MCGSVKNEKRLLTNFAASVKKTPTDPPTFLNSTTSHIPTTTFEIRELSYCLSHLFSNIQVPILFKKNAFQNKSLLQFICRNIPFLYRNYHIIFVKHFPYSYGVCGCVGEYCFFVQIVL